MTVFIIYTHWFDFLENQDPIREEIVGYVETKQEAEDYVKKGGKIPWGYGSKSEKNRYYYIKVDKIEDIPS